MWPDQPSIRHTCLLENPQVLIHVVSISQVVDTLLDMVCTDGDCGSLMDGELMPQLQRDIWQLRSEFCKERQQPAHEVQKGDPVSRLQAGGIGTGDNGQ